jgi:hypothetical protein
VAWIAPDHAPEVGVVHHTQHTPKELRTLAKWCIDAAEYIEECQKKATSGLKAQP